MFVLAHLSDPHLAPLPFPRPRELLSKRGLGYINWLRKRRKIHRAEMLAALVADLKDHAPDHIAVTGDLVNLSLPAEYPRARAWLGSLGLPQDVSLVPGNHDNYVRGAADLIQSHWHDFMRGEGADGAAFPYLRRRGPVALIGLSTAIPTGLFMATGQLGNPQLARLAKLLEQSGNEGLFRVVLIHHPPVSRRAQHFKRLRDAAALRATLAQQGAELLLHGHDHVLSLRWLDGERGRIPAVGVPSASEAIPRKHDSAGYNLYRIEGGPGAWRCELCSRGLAPDGESIVERHRQKLT
jgi:3',5'-cyclic AMP phosphodiesterase CpdA